MAEKNKDLEHAYLLFDKKNNRYAKHISSSPYDNYATRFKISFSQNPSASIFKTMARVTGFYEKAFEMSMMRDQYDMELFRGRDLDDLSFEHEHIIERHTLKDHIARIDKAQAEIEQLQLIKIKLQAVKESTQLIKEKQQEIKRLVTKAFISKIETEHPDGTQLAHDFLNRYKKPPNKQAEALYLCLNEEKVGRYTGTPNGNSILQIAKSCGCKVHLVTAHYGFVGNVYFQTRQDRNLFKLAMPEDMSCTNEISVVQLQDQQTKVKKFVTRRMKQLWDLK